MKYFFAEQPKAVPLILLVTLDVEINPQIYWRKINEQRAIITRACFKQVREKASLAKPSLSKGGGPS